MVQIYTADCFAAGHSAQTDMQNIEDNFAAHKSSFSGTSQPANPVEGMPWFDTTNDVQKRRNAANTAWKVAEFKSGTVCLFGQASAPIGWTKLTSWADNSMLCINTQADGTALSAGGSGNPQSTHTHTGPSHTHTGPSHAHTLSSSADGGLLYSSPSNPAATWYLASTGAAGTGATSSGGDGDTGVNTAPLFQEIIAATKD